MRRKHKAQAKAIAQTFDPALWSITTVLSIAIIYLARLI